MSRSTRPFFPCQTEAGATYVIDGRTGKIASTVFCDFDTTGRWRVATQRAKRLNDEFETMAVVRRRLFLMLSLTGTIIALVIWFIFAR